MYLVRVTGRRFESVAALEDDSPETGRDCQNGFTVSMGQMARLLLAVKMLEQDTIGRVCALAS